MGITYTMGRNERKEARGMYMGIVVCKNTVFGKFDCASAC